MKEEKLIPRSLQDLIEEHNVDRVLDGEVILDLPLDMIIANPFQPRRIFDQEKINELADSIKQHGVFQPIIVKKNKDSKYLKSFMLMLLMSKNFSVGKQENINKIIVLEKA